MSSAHPGTARFRAAAREPRSDALRNQQQLARAATALIHRDGPGVALGRIADQAGVGIGTLYRHFPTREHLLAHLTHRSFELVLAHARAAEEHETTAVDSLRHFVAAGIARRDELVLPLHGGPPLRSVETRAVRAEVHQILGRIVERGTHDGTLREGVRPYDVVVLGAMLSQPRPDDPQWEDTARRLLDAYLRGLAP